MGVYNEQGEAIEEPESRHMQIKERAGRSRRPRQGVPSPMSRRGQFCKVPPKDVFNDMMFMVGGWTSKDPSCPVEEFCPEYNEWRPAAPMVAHRGGVAVCPLEGQIYTVGGADAVSCYSNVERYDPDTKAWSADVAHISSPRSGVCLVEMEGYLYAIGGYDGMAATTTVERYDPKMNTWSKQIPLPAGRTRASAVVLDGHLYVIGGSDGSVVLSTVERYDPVDGTWSPCPSMRTPRESAGCTVYLGRIYVAGGKDELSLELSAAEKFDPENMRWSPVKRMRSKRSDVSLVVFYGALLAVGGSDDITNMKTIEVYSHETNTWRHFGSMKTKHPGGRVAILRSDYDYMM